MNRSFFQLLAFSLLLSNANADITITAIEVGNHVEFSFPNGSLDLAGASVAVPQLIYGGGGTIDPDDGLAIFADGGGFVNVTIYNGLSGPVSYGNGGTIRSTSSSGGGSVGFDARDTGGVFYVPVNYTSGSTLAASQMTFENQSFTTLGITPGVYVYSLPSGDTITFNAIPEPGCFGIGVCMGAVYCLRRKR